MADVTYNPLSWTVDPPKLTGLTPGIYCGTVAGTMLPNNLISVKLDNEMPVDCIWAAGIISGLLGFKLSYIPPVETKVLVYVTKELGINYIIGSFPDATINVLSPKRSVTDPNGMDYHESQKFKARKTGDPLQMAACHKPPIDLAEGEIQLDNLMGVGISLLRHFASLQAGDLARVECHLMDDMVRIISGLFVHHSAFGDVKISNDAGKLNAEWNGTSFDFEAWGAERSGDAKAKMGHPDHPDLGKKSQIDGFEDDGRWRFSQYVGWLGNFINLFVTDPAEKLGKLAETQVRSGKFRMHVNDDGSLVVQSVADIVLEKVIRIPVPIRKKREDDPKGNRSDSSLMGTDNLTLWQPSGTNIFEMAYQLRDYARWLNNTYSLARFYQMDKDFKVPTEAETPAPDPLCKQIDREEADLLADFPPGVSTTFGYRFVYSCIRIFRDGSIVIWDGYGNSFTMSKNGIQISSVSNLLLEAAGSVNIIAGRDINLVSQRNITISAMLDTVRIAAKQSIQTMVEAGYMVLDFLLPGVLKVNHATVNANDSFSIGLAGQVDTYGTVSSSMGFFASLTDGPFGYVPHIGHVFPGAPAVEPAEALVFTYATQYDPPLTEPLYQSLAQSSLSRHEIFDITDPAGSVTVPWPLAANINPTLGSPWPGIGAVQYKTVFGVTLNRPLDGQVLNAPKPMIPVPPVMQVKPFTPS